MCKISHPVIENLNKKKREILIKYAFAAVNEPWAWFKEAIKEWQLKKGMINFII